MGTDGLNGAQGAQGPQGPQGPQGIPGPAGAGTGDMLKANNLSDVASKPSSLSNLGGVAKIGDTMTGTLTINGGSLVAGSGMGATVPLAGTAFVDWLSLAGSFGLSVYWDGTSWKYRTTGWGGIINFNSGDGSYSWANTPSGAAGANCGAFTNRLVLAGNGDLNSGGAVHAGGDVTGGNFTANGVINANGAISSNGAINAAGQITSTSGDGIRCTVGPGGYARFVSTVTGGVRSWSCGTWNDGTFRITDESGVTPILTLNYIGSTGMNTLAGYLQTQGYACKQGISGGYGPNNFNFFYAGGTMQVWADATNMGNMYIVSDYRTKKDVVDLPDTWAVVKKLRPIKYTQADAFEGLFVADELERWGFLAHELQDTLVPSAATGVKDEPNVVQNPNPMAIIAALTKALQQAMLRIEALEAAR
jgi:hypothetical protein